MLRFIWDLIKSLIFRSGWRFPEFIIRPTRLLHEDGLVMSTAFVGRQGVGKTFTLANELLEQIKGHPEQPFFIFDCAVGADTHQEVMGGGIFLVDIMIVVGGYERYIELFAYGDEMAVDLHDLRDWMPHDFKVKIAERVAVPGSCLFGLFAAPSHD